jgi:NAD(P)H-flavin reductase
LIDEGRKIDLVIAIGPAIMMKVVSELTKKYGIKTIVSLNSIMLDATGMCGVCRVEVGGKTMFACVDGPEFDGHLVNFDLLIKRLNTYKEEERLALERFLKEGV